jgi:serine/threonine protein kinase
MAPPEKVLRAKPAEGADLPGYVLGDVVAIDRAGSLVAATDRLTSAAVVLRVLSPASSASSAYVRGLRRALPALLGLRHPNLVPVLSFEERAKVLVYQPLTGTPLSRLIEAEGRIPDAAAFTVLDDCLAGLSALHDAGLAHGDVRPGSVIVDPSGAVRLRDACVPSPPLRRGWAPGTPQYMAPELWAGAPPSAAADLYAAACLFFEALAGTPPYPGSDLDQLRSLHERGAVPEGVLPAVARGLVLEGADKEPAARPRSAARYRADLATAAAASLEDGWRARGRAWLATNASIRAGETPAPAALGGLAVPSAEERDLAPPVLGLGSEPKVRDQRLWAGAAAAAVALVAGLVVAAGLHHPAGSPSTAPTPAPPVAASPPPPTSLSAPPSSGAPAPAPPSSQPGAPAAAPRATPAPTPTPRATPAPTPCVPVVPVCP